MNNMPPRIKLEIEGVTYNVLHYLGQHHDEIEKAVEEQLRFTLENYDFQAVVAEAVRRSVRHAVEEYFRLGPGAAAIQKGVEDTFTPILDALFVKKDDRP